MKVILRPPKRMSLISSTTLQMALGKTLIGTDINSTDETLL